MPRASMLTEQRLVCVASSMTVVHIFEAIKTGERANHTQVSFCATKIINIPAYFARMWNVMIAETIDLGRSTSSRSQIPATIRIESFHRIICKSWLFFTRDGESTQVVVFPPSAPFSSSMIMLCMSLGRG